MALFRVVDDRNALPVTTIIFATILPQNPPFSLNEKGVSLNGAIFPQCSLLLPDALC